MVQCISMFIDCCCLIHHNAITACDIKCLEKHTVISINFVKFLSRLVSGSQQNLSLASMLSIIILLESSFLGLQMVYVHQSQRLNTLHLSRSPGSILTDMKLFHKCSKPSIASTSWQLCTMFFVDIACWSEQHQLMLPLALMEMLYQFFPMLVWMRKVKC